LNILSLKLEKTSEVPGAKMISEPTQESIEGTVEETGQISTPGSSPATKTDNVVESDKDKQPIVESGKEKQPTSLKTSKTAIQADDTEKTSPTGSKVDAEEEDGIYVLLQAYPLSKHVAKLLLVHQMVLLVLIKGSMVAVQRCEHWPISCSLCVF
jgi:hypothetical protein